VIRIYEKAQPGGLSAMEAALAEKHETNSCDSNVLASDADGFDALFLFSG
jgi:hypothetical protein